ncbi:MAG: DUF3800 domain-containing protein [Candidatus Heimdallarchaeum aukensis]|uniref:DUF3800 domain-containing protein n=1 Tax=Candidatus Heimdallarchaeum aukensis TaxID=2876573 RepID=A0A9Y1BKA8_9ARCH|nr:MAG: DUF3800 domain-containing protein [Candidatus Heimdallarchaeum aukensis]
MGDILTDKSLKFRNNSITLEVFCDEINKVRLPYDNSWWMYLGALFVPVTKKQELIDTLLNLRCIKHHNWHWDTANCPHKCKYHTSNNAELHFHSIHKRIDKFKIAKKWLSFLVEENNKRDLGLIYFYILGLDLTKLNLENFGEKKGVDMNIYNRFFRTVISGAKYFFNEYEIIFINKIYHDKGNQEKHRYFPWYTPYKLNINDNKLFILDKDIRFVDSNHKNYPDTMGNDFRRESQLIQFIDIILGSVHCLLHATSKHPKKIELAQIMEPLLERLMYKPQNKNSKYHYYRKQQIKFFPKNPINTHENKLKQLDMQGDLIETKILESNNFYTKRKIMLKDPKQQTLDPFFV